MSFVPIVCVPLNIMCSKKWARPVIPGRSLAEPTWATQAAATVVSSGRFTSRNRMPLSSSNSSTGTAAAVWALRVAAAAGQTNAVVRTASRPNSAAAAAPFLRSGQFTNASPFRSPNWRP